MDSNKLRPGHTIMYEGQPCKVIDATRRQQPRMVAKIITKLQNILTGATVEKTFTSGEDIKEADVTTLNVQYIYNDGLNYVFMDNVTIEQYEMGADKIGKAKNFIKEEMIVSLVLYDEKPIDIQVPLSVTLQIAETEPGVKGDTVSAAMKPAILETGFKVQVPLFIEEGEFIIINTETGEYKGRAK